MMDVTVQSAEFDETKKTTLREFMDSEQSKERESCSERVSE